MRGDRDGRKRALVMQALVDGRTVKDAADTAKTTRKTIYKWAKTDGELAELLEDTKKARKNRRGPKPPGTKPPPSVVDRADDEDEVWLGQLRKGRRLSLATLTKVMNDGEAKDADKIKAASEILRASESAPRAVKAAGPGAPDAKPSKPVLKLVTPEDAARRLAL